MVSEVYILSYDLIIILEQEPNYTSFPSHYQFYIILLSLHKETSQVSQVLAVFRTFIFEQMISIFLKSGQQVSLLATTMSNIICDNKKTNYVCFELNTKGIGNINRIAFIFFVLLMRNRKVQLCSNASQTKNALISSHMHAKISCESEMRTQKLSFVCNSFIVRLQHGLQLQRLVS